jgi:hypothetical protein
MNDLVIFHYHLLPGGVTDVIVQGVMAMAHSSHLFKHITFVCGRKENTDNVIKKVSDYFSEQKSRIKLEITVIPEIDYINHIDKTDTLQKKVNRLKNMLISSFSSPIAIWWMHNYQLGKNPVFSEAVLQIVDSNPDQRVILQIHDFPEAGRPHNMIKLKKIVSRPFYPVAHNVRYIVINVRDRDILHKAGLPKELIYLIENPISSFPGKLNKPREVKKVLAEFGRHSGYAVEKDSELAIYPIRAIRRKNVLEAGLLTKLLSQKAVLLVTLPGVSQSERAYSDFVQQCFREKLIPGIFGIGLELEKLGISFPSLLAASSLMCCSSVQEGFGYPYLQSLLLGIPLLARKLDVMDGFINMFDHYPAVFYTQLLVPLEEKEKAHLKKAYLSYLNTLRNVLSPSLVRTLTAEVENLFHNELVDFSYLSFDLQRSILSRACSSTFSEQVRSINRPLFADAKRLLSSTAKAKKEHVLSRFGLNAYAESVEQIIESFSDNISLNPISADLIDDAVLKLFSSLQYLRLLFAPKLDKAE